MSDCSSWRFYGGEVSVDELDLCWDSHSGLGPEHVERDAGKKTRIKLA